VYADDRPLADYDESGARRVFVHLCSAAQWTAITGELPPPTPVDRDAYVDEGLPWFDFYNADARDLDPSEIFPTSRRSVKSLAPKRIRLSPSTRRR
jgi:hypothetical protein